MPVETGRTVNEWIEDWFEAREARGLATVGDDRSRYDNHVRDRLGTLGIGSVSRDDIEGLVEELDRKVLAGEISWKTAQHIWGLVTVMFADACGAKRRDLRARADNPTTGVHGPDRGEDKAKAYLYPAEFSKLVACEALTVEWRRFFAITIYLYARAGEVLALTWDDLDLERGIALIHQAANRRTGEISTTKSDRTRRVPIERELLPLLKAMHRESGGTGRVVEAMEATDKKLSKKLRHALERAGVERAELFVKHDATWKAITFHDLRATGITWMAVRGDEPLKITQRAGHADFQTTQGYIREAENLRDGDFGEPFPPLPPELLEPPPAIGPELGYWAGGEQKPRENSGGAGNRKQEESRPKTHFPAPIRTNASRPTSRLEPKLSGQNRNRAKRSTRTRRRSTIARRELFFGRPRARRSPLRARRPTTHRSSRAFGGHREAAHDQPRLRASRLRQTEVARTKRSLALLFEEVPGGSVRDRGSQSGSRASRAA